MEKKEANGETFEIIMIEDIKKMMETVDQIGQEYIETMFMQTNMIYTDARYLIDFELTALLCLMNEEEYPLILKQIENYNARSSRGLFDTFKGLHVSQEQVDAFLKNPDKLMYAHRMQYTSYFEYFLDCLRTWNTRNHLNSEDPQPMTVYVGYGSYPFPMMHRAFVVEKIKQFAPDAIVLLTDRTIESYPDHLFRELQHFSIFDVESTFNHPHVMKQIQAGALNGKGLHTFPFVNPIPKNQIPKGVKREELSDEARLTRENSFMNLFFNFEHVRAKVHHEKR